MMQELKTSRRARLAGVALLLVAFATGGLTGAAASRVLDVREAPRPEGRADGERQERRPSTEDFLSRLELTEEQRAAVDSILDQRRDQIDAIWKEMRPRMRALGDSARTEIGSVLTEEQRAEYEAFLEEQRQRHRGRGSDRGEPGKNGKTQDEQNG